WWAAGASLLAASATILRWLWTGTAEIPEMPEKDVGRGVRLPLYRSGQPGVGWWGMFITMLADGTAFVSLVFGFVFYWMARRDFLFTVEGPDAFFPTLAAVLAIGAWMLTRSAWRANNADRPGPYYGSLGVAALLATGAGGAILAGPAAAGLQPER